MHPISHALLALPLALASVNVHAVAFTQTTITADTAVLNTGTLIAANNLGGPTIAATVNGIAFGVDESGLGNLVDGSSSDFHNNAIEGLSAGLDNILSTLVYTANTAPGTLTLDSLVIGWDYRLQLLVSNDINPTGENQSIVVEGDTHAMGNWRPNAVNVIAEFTATDSTLDVALLNGGNRTVFNGYALHALSSASVPVPATLALLGLGMLGMMVSRRQRQD